MKMRVSGNIFIVDYGFPSSKGDFSYSIVCPITGSGWGIPTKDIAPDDLRAMADHLEASRLAMDKGNKE